MKRIALVAFMSLVPAVAAAGGVKGTWSGSVSQPGARPYSLRLTLDGASGSADYPELGCGGTLSLVSDGGNTLTYRESITRGREKCIDGNVTVSLSADGRSMQWSWR